MAKRIVAFCFVLLTAGICTNALAKESLQLKAKYLQSVLDAIETPAQRVSKEAEEQAERIKQAKIKELLSFAQSNDNKTDGKKALEALEKLLKLNPSHSQALALQKKIRAYFAPSAGDVITNSIGMKLVHIPAGEFMMGNNYYDTPDEKPVHKVKLSKCFYMGIYEVTQAQYRAVMGTSPSLFKGDNNPVEQVTWNDATEFCKKLSQKEGKAYTLPTEAQWEYACRAGTTTVFSFGNDRNNLNDYAWYGYKKSDKGTHPVGTKRPNAFGLYDIHGNVMEWCRDWYDKDYYSKSKYLDPENTQNPRYRVLRGGAWNYPAFNCRSADRNGCNPRTPYYGTGFRVILSVSSRSD